MPSRCGKQHAPACFAHFITTENAHADAGTNEPKSSVPEKVTTRAEHLCDRACRYAGPEITRRTRPRPHRKACFDFDQYFETLGTTDTLRINRNSNALFQRQSGNFSRYYQRLTVLVVRMITNICYRLYRDS